MLVTFTPYSIYILARLMMNVDKASQGIGVGHPTSGD